MGDQYFDGIAQKFDKNIYGSLKGKLRQRLLVNILEEKLKGVSPISILDLGAGTGVMSEQLINWGHSVDVVEPSYDAIDIAKQRLTTKTLNAGQTVSFYHASLQDFAAPKQYEFVICHAVLEWLDEPLVNLQYVLQHVAKDGILSLSVFNKDAALFGNMAYGNFDYVQKGMKVRNQVRLNPKNPVTPNALLNELEKNRFEVMQKTGIRCFADYVKRPIEDAEFEQLFDLEVKYSQVEPFSRIGKYFHVLASPIITINNH